MLPSQSLLKQRRAALATVRRIYKLPEATRFVAVQPESLEAEFAAAAGKPLLCVGADLGDHDEDLVELYFQQVPPPPTAVEAVREARGRDLAMPPARRTKARRT